MFYKYIEERKYLYEYITTYKKSIIIQGIGKLRRRAKEMQNRAGKENHKGKDERTL